MSDADPTVPEPTGPEPATGEAPPTGVTIVDEVLAGLEGVAERPVADRVGEFERAHEGLRRALDDEPAPATRRADPGSDPGSSGA